MIIYDPDGGDLGRAYNLKSITALELKTIAPHIANMLAELAVSGLSKLPFKYAFEVHSAEKDMAQMAIQGIKLPTHVEWYEINGNKLFEMRGASGGIVTSYICYLVTEWR